MPAKQKGVKITPEQERRVKAIADGRPGGGITFSQAIREAIDTWLGESPQAMDAYEMWLLRASRAARAEYQRGWAGALRGFNGLLKGFAPRSAMEEWMYDSLGKISSQGGEQQFGAEDYAALRTTAKRREPKAR